MAAAAAAAVVAAVACLLQELGGQVPARLVFRAQGLADGWKDTNVRRAVVRGTWLAALYTTTSAPCKSVPQYGTATNTA
jgi:hypothetical protein